MLFELFSTSSHIMQLIRPAGTIMSARVGQRSAEGPIGA